MPYRGSQAARAPERGRPKGSRSETHAARDGVHARGPGTLLVNPEYCAEKRLSVRTTHPFVIDVRPCGVLQDRFVWNISRKGCPKRHSIRTYATFEEARLAGKSKLAVLIAAWQRSERSAEPKEVT